MSPSGVWPEDAALEQVFDEEAVVGRLETGEETAQRVRAWQASLSAEDRAALHPDLQGAITTLERLWEREGMFRAAAGATEGAADLPVLPLPAGYDSRAAARDIARLGSLASWPWHTQQQFALAAATNVVVILGGSQSGKSTVAAGIVARLMRREGPIYRRLRNPEARSLKIWVSPQTFEKYKSNWEHRILEDVFGGISVNYVQSPLPVFTWDDHIAQGNSLWGKSQDQGFLAFESDAVDLVVLDEEPADRRIVTSAQQRLATTNGVIVLAFTPLLGISWTHSAYYVPTHKPEYRVADRVWRHGNAVTLISAGMQDNPAAVAGGGVARVQSDPSMSQSERNTRLYGDYGYTQGLIFPEFADLRVEVA